MKTWIKFSIVAICSATAGYFSHFIDWGSANTPSWVQAVGSIAAIFGAAWIANDQYRKQALDNRIRSTVQASICCDGIETTYGEVLGLIRSYTPDAHIVTVKTNMLHFLQRSFAGHIVDMGTVSIGDLRFSDAVAFAHARRLCRTMEHVIGITLMDQPNADLAQVVSILNERWPGAQEHARILRNSRGELVGE